MDSKEVKLESMKIAAELLCCVMKGGGSLGDQFPETTDGNPEVSLEILFFALTDKIFREVEDNTP